MGKLYNLARMTTATSGTGTITLGSAVSGFLTFALAGVADGDVVSYGISDGANGEVGTGTYTASGTTLTRTVTKSTNSNTAISLSGSAQVFITPRAEDIVTASPKCGRFSYVSTTSAKFIPYDGEMIRIAGALYQIPSGGIAGLGNTASCFVNGTGAQAVAASTLYYVYAFINSGTVTADFSTTAHSMDTTAGNVGTEIKTGDNSRTLIGMVRTDGSNHLADSETQRFTSSWFNRIPLSLSNAFTANRSTTSNTFVEINSEIRCEFVIWTSGILDMSANGIFYTTSGTGTAYYSAITIDGATPSTTGGGTSIHGEMFSSSSINTFLAQNVKFTGLSEGYHYATISGHSASANTTTWGDHGNADVTLKGLVL